jgi:hypothetical protein
VTLVMLGVTAPLARSREMLTAMNSSKNFRSHMCKFLCGNTSRRALSRGINAVCLSSQKKREEMGVAGSAEDGLA